MLAQATAVWQPIQMKSPIRQTDDDARALAKGLIASSTFAALAVETPDGPMISRIAIAQLADNGLVALVSELSHHTQALRTSPRVSLLIGEPGPKGDPLTHPRLSLQAEVAFVEHASEAYAGLAKRYLEKRPKAQLYIGFTDFVFLEFEPKLAQLNGGFGKAYTLEPEDLI